MSFARASVPSRLFRLSRYADPTKLTDWRYLANAEPGRWSDPEGEYRVLYTADSEVGAYVEVLQDLRPSGEAIELLNEIEDDGDFGDTLGTLEGAARERLREYHLGALIPGESDNDVIADVTAAASRTEIDVRLSADLGRRVKVGDFSGSDYDLTRRVSRLVYIARYGDELRFAGLSARSGEHAPSLCFAYFESGRETNELRGKLHVHFVRQALEEDDHVQTAIAYLTS